MRKVNVFCHSESKRVKLFTLLCGIIMMSNGLLAQTQNVSTDTTQYARPIALDTETQVITVYTFEDNQKWIVESKKQQPKDKIAKDTTYYLLVKGMWMQTTQKDKGDLLYDCDTLPLDNIVIGTSRVANINDRKVIKKDIHPSLNVRIVHQRVKHKYNESITSQPEFELYKDSIVSVSDTTFFVFNDGNSKAFQIVIDTLLLQDDSFYSENQIGISDSLSKLLRLPIIDSTQLEPKRFPLRSRIQVIPEGYILTSFIHEIDLEINEVYDITEKPFIPKSEDPLIPIWCWIVIGVIIALIVLFFVFRKKFKSIQKGNLKEKSHSFDEPTKTNQENEIKELRKEINRLTGLKEKLSKEIESWKQQTEYDSPSKAKAGISKLKSDLTIVTKEKANLEREKKDLKQIVDLIKQDPESFLDNNDYNKLSQLIKNAQLYHTIRKTLNENPMELDPTSASGQLVAKGKRFEEYLKTPKNILHDKEHSDSDLATQVKKGYFMDDAKNDVKLIRTDEYGWFRDTELLEFINYIVDPDKILKSTRTKTGLYKLVSDIETISKNTIEGKTTDADIFTSLWLKGKIGDTVEHANRYIQFGQYKNYWVNIVNPLFNMLNDLQNHDQIFNTRILMFYSSQFYSIACIMNEIYGNPGKSTEIPMCNIGLFNSTTKPVMNKVLGFPILDEATLQRNSFEFKGLSDEEQIVKYLKTYKPLPFIFVYSYFDDNRLS